MPRCNQLRRYRREKCDHQRARTEHQSGVDRAIAVERLKHLGDQRCAAEQPETEHEKEKRWRWRSCGSRASENRSPDLHDESSHTMVAIQPINPIPSIQQMNGLPNQSSI